MRVVFRADASPIIGTGHVVRCLTLAGALKRQGADVEFVCREMAGGFADAIAAGGYRLHLLSPGREAPDRGGPVHAAWLHASAAEDADATREAIAGGVRPDWLVVDHYALDARWETALRPHAKRLTVIDDLADRRHDCDLLLDQNLVGNAEIRYAGKVPAHCGFMLGPHYALLQPEYAELHDCIPPREGPIQRILVYFGGGDAHNLTGMAINAFMSLGRADIQLDVVASARSPHAETIHRQVAGQSNIHLHGDLPTLAPLMAGADLAIGAGGATSWERCCLGLPSAVITLAENQRPIAAELARREVIRWLGHVGEVGEADLVRVLKELLNEGLAESWSNACRQLVDGQGANRVCAILTLSPATPLRVRRVRLDDEALVLQWANDPLVRQNAFSAGYIDAATHRAWFRTRLRDLVHCRFYIVETRDGLPIGPVRFGRSGSEWEVHYSVDALCRGVGLAKPMLEAAIANLRSDEAGALVFGRVKEDNRLSRRVFEGLGFAPDAAPGGEIVYRRPA
jgi:UDP-2,4-diacetamido-2,4,6-trideoxy-beta-L-altropyranose hydrolase